jgi:hypothetical protein
MSSNYISSLNHGMTFTLVLKESERCVAKRYKQVMLH